MGPSRTKKLRTVFKKLLSPAPSAEKIFTLPSYTLPSQYRSLLPARDPKTEELLKLEKINGRIRNVVVALAATLIVFFVGAASFLVVAIFHYSNTQDKRLPSLSMPPSPVDHVATVELSQASHTKTQAYKVLATGSQCMERCWEFSAFKFSATCERGRCRCHNKNYQRDTCLPVYGKCAIQLLQPDDLPPSLQVLYKDQAQPVYMCSPRSLSHRILSSSTLPETQPGSAEAGRRSPGFSKVDATSHTNTESPEGVYGGEDMRENKQRQVVSGGSRDTVTISTLNSLEDTDPNLPTTEDSHTPLVELSMVTTKPTQTSVIQEHTTSMVNPTSETVTTTHIVFSEENTNESSRSLTTTQQEIQRTTQSPAQTSEQINGLSSRKESDKTSLISTLSPEKIISISLHRTDSPIFSTQQDTFDSASTSGKPDGRIKSKSNKKHYQTEPTSTLQPELTSRPKSSHITSSTSPSSQQQQQNLDLSSTAVPAMENSRVHVISVHSDRRSSRHAVTNVTVSSSQRQSRIVLVLVSYGGPHWNLVVDDTIEVARILLVSNHRISTCSVSFSRRNKHETDYGRSEGTVPSPAPRAETFSQSASPAVTRKLLRTGYGDDRRRGSTPQLLESISRIVGEVDSFIGVARADEVVYNTDFYVT